jgi:hypothetical protein
MSVYFHYYFLEQLTLSSTYFLLEIFSVLVNILRSFLRDKYFSLHASFEVILRHAINLTLYVTKVLGMNIVLFVSEDESSVKY